MKKKLKFQDFEITFENMTWKIKMVDAVSCVMEIDNASVEAYGYCDYRKKEIVVCYKEHDIQMVRITLGHELAHMMLNLIDMSSNKKYDPELTAELVGRGLSQISWQLPKWFYTL